MMCFVSYGKILLGVGTCLVYLGGPLSVVVHRGQPSPSGFLEVGGRGWGRFCFSSGVQKCSPVLTQELITQHFLSTRVPCAEYRYREEEVQPLAREWPG